MSTWFGRMFGRRDAAPRQLSSGELRPFSGAQRLDSFLAERSDGWGNVITGLMTGRDKRRGAVQQYRPMVDLEAREWWLGDDIAKRIIETLPKLAMHRGYDLKIADDEDREMSEQLVAKMEDLQFDQKVTKAMMMKRAYGGAALFPVIDGAQDDLRLPIDLTRIRNVVALHLLEPRELLPTSWYTDLRNPKFGTPERFMFIPVLTGGVPPPQTLSEIHESRLILFQGTKVSRLYQPGDRIGWGDSVLTPIRDVIMDFGLAWSSASALLQDFAQAVLKIEGLANLITTDQDKVARARIEQIDFIRSVMRMIVIDKNDEFSREETPISGLAQLLDRFCVRMAAGADMPITWLMGQSPAGLNSTGESDREIMYDRARAEQHETEPQIEQGIRLVMLSSEGPCEGKEPDVWGINFRPLSSPDDQDIAKTHNLDAVSDDYYIKNGTLTTDEVRNRWRGDKYGDIQLDDDAWQKQQDLQAKQIDAAARAALKAPADSATGGGTARPLDVPNADGKVQPGDSTQKLPDSDNAPAQGVTPLNAGAGQIMIKPHVRSIPKRGAIAAPVTAGGSAAGRADRDRFDDELADEIAKELASDYPPEALTWIRSIKWEGPERVDLADIDFSNADQWQASREPDKVEKFVQRINAGWSKPILLVKRPGMDKLMIVDGHHRALAYQKLGRRVIAFVGTATSNVGPWDDFHNSQRSSPDKQIQRAAMTNGTAAAPSTDTAAPMAQPVASSMR
jgi:hypothetical protein